MGVGMESGRGRESAWGSEREWAVRMDRQEQWITRERGWARGVDGAGRVVKAGTVDAGGGVAQLIFFVPLPTF